MSRDGRGRRKYRQPPCGVLTPHGFCELPQKRFGRCAYHVECLKADSHFEMLRKAKAADRKRIIAVLDAAQKVRPHWEYEGDEASLIAAQESGEKNG
jgi:hypothetical protein